MTARILEGDTVRYNVDNLKARFPRAAEDINQNSAMIVLAVDKDTSMYTLGRQGVAIDGSFHESELVKCDPETGEPLPPAPPDTLPGGEGEDTSAGGTSTNPNV